jgi:SAM-dependent methyltransferase
MDKDVRKWEFTSRKYSGGKYMDPLLDEQFRRVHLDLIRRWAPQLEQPRILKTDVFAEATCPPRAFSWDIGSTNRLVSVDISPSLVMQARENARALGYGNSAYTAGDARALPFADGSFDVVVSDSTLDHFHDKDDIRLGLAELARVLRPGGVLIVTLDNPWNLSEPLFRLWIALHMSPFFIGKTLSARSLRRALTELDLDVTYATAILHNTRLFAKAGIRLLRMLKPPGYERVAARLLRMGDTMEHAGTRYLTGQFVAVRAVKPLSGS